MIADFPDCKDFTGYKPCHPGEDGEACVSPKPRGKKLLIINIGAMGAVLMTTTVLPAIKRKYPASTIYWLTVERITPLLKNNPYIDRIFTYDFNTVMILREMKFDVVMNTDKVHEICALTNGLLADVKLGFGMNGDGVIIPLNEGSNYNYRLGIDNRLKFIENERTYPQMLRDICELDDNIDPYVFRFTKEEKNFINEYKSCLDLDFDFPVVGINTGSSGLFSNKRIPIDVIESLISELYEINSGQRVVLVGGFEDEKRNLELEKKFGDKVINTPTTEGLRKGMTYVDLCDVVITADSLGMHMAIALGKKVVGWFNVTCAPEIELYGMGEKVISEVECSPCWKQDCDQDLNCLNDDIKNKLIKAVKNIM